MSQVSHRAAALRIWLIRHAEPLRNRMGYLDSRDGIPLSEAGHVQAARLAARLAREPLAAVYSSPMRRAMDTATPIANAGRLSVIQNNGFREIDFGDFEGREFDDLQITYPELYEQWMARPTEMTFPNGESFSGFKQRVMHAFKGLTRRKAPATIAVVSHAGVNRLLIANALSLCDDCLFRIGQNYASLSRIAYFDNSAVVELLNGSAGDSAGT